jgi:hypothetical protein
MRRILLICTGAALLMLPTAASAGAARGASRGFVVVRNASGAGVNGHAVVTVVVQGFVLGRVSPKAQARVAVYHLPSATEQGGPQVAGSDVSQRSVRWRTAVGKEYSGSGFRFSAIGGAYRVVVRGAGLYLFAGGRGRVWLQGSSVYRGSDGRYSLNGAAARSLPTQRLTVPLGRA